MLLNAFLVFFNECLVCLIFDSFSIITTSNVCFMSVVDIVLLNLWI